MDKKMMQYIMQTLQLPSLKYHNQIFFLAVKEINPISEFQNSDMYHMFAFFFLIM